MRHNRSRWTESFLRSRAGEPALFGGLTEDLRSFLLARLRLDSRTRCLARCAQDLEDIVQERFLRLAAEISEFRQGPAKVLTSTTTHR